MMNVHLIHLQHYFPALFVPRIPQLLLEYLVFWNCEQQRLSSNVGISAHWRSS